MNNNINKSDKTGGAKSVEKANFCPRCKRQIEIGSDVCPECGSPTNRFSSLCYVHRSVITAFGSLFAIISVVVLICNLENQQKIFIEEYQPRFLLKQESIKKAGQDSIKIGISLKNNGKSDARNLRIQITSTTIPDSSVNISVFRQDILSMGETTTNIHDIPQAFGKHLIVEYLASYTWEGQPDSKLFENRYAIIYDNKAKIYTRAMLDSPMIDGLWKIRESFLENLKNKGN